MTPNRDGSFAGSTGRLRWGFTGRRQGDMRDTGRRNRFLGTIGFGESFCFHPRQVHGTLVAGIGSEEERVRLDFADAAVGSGKKSSDSFSLNVITADCLPVIMIDIRNRVAAAGHAGWRGVISGMAFSMTDAMVAAGAVVDSIAVYIGPHIRNCCYTIDPDRVKRFGTIPIFKQFVTLQKETPYLDLTGCFVKTLGLAGIPSVRVHDTAVCTSCNAGEYYSYRNSKNYPYGENLGYVGFV